MEGGMQGIEMSRFTFSWLNVTTMSAVSAHNRSIDIHHHAPGAIRVFAARATFTGGITMRGNEATKNGGGETINHFGAYAFAECPWHLSCFLRSRIWLVTIVRGLSRVVEPLKPMHEDANLSTLTHTLYGELRHRVVVQQSSSSTSIHWVRCDSR